MAWGIITIILNRTSQIFVKTKFKIARYVDDGRGGEIEKEVFATKKFNVQIGRCGRIGACCSLGNFSCLGGFSILLEYQKR